MKIVIPVLLVILALILYDGSRDLILDSLVGWNHKAKCEDAYQRYLNRVFLAISHDDLYPTDEYAAGCEDTIAGRWIIRDYREHLLTQLSKTR